MVGLGASDNTDTMTGEREVRRDHKIKKPFARLWGDV